MVATLRIKKTSLRSLHKLTWVYGLSLQNVKKKYLSSGKMNPLNDRILKNKEFKSQFN